MAKYKFITVIGNIAAGKSTLVELLSEKMPAREVPADSLFRINPFFPLALTDRVRWSLASDLWFLYERVKMTRDIPEQVKRNHVVVDSGLPMSFVYARSRLVHGYLTDDEWELYKAIHDEIIPKTRFPDKVIYLKAPIDMILERIKKRDRKFELKHYNRKYLKGLAIGLGLVVKKLEVNKVKIVPVDVAKVDFVKNEADLQGLIDSVL